MGPCLRTDQNSRQRFKNFLGLFFIQVFVIIVIDLHHRRRAAGGETFDFAQGKAAIGGGLPDIDAEFSLDESGKALRSAERA